MLGRELEQIREIVQCNDEPKGSETAEACSNMDVSNRETNDYELDFDGDSLWEEYSFFT